MNSLRVRIAALAGVVLLAVLGSTAYVLHVRDQQREAEASAPKVETRGDLAALRGASHIVFRNTALGDGYGQVAIVPVTDPGGSRAITPAVCERVFATAADALCLSADRGIVTTYKSTVLGPDWTAVRDLPLTGLPSRARVSADGKLAATTTFVFGDSYASPGQFSTRTLVSALDGSQNLDLEQFQLVVNGQTIAAADRNLWGVTFADADTFYATAASGGKTWLVRGSLAQRRLTSIREDVECPSLSPDGTRIAFKKHGNLPAGQWRLAVYHLTTRTETLLAETHSVDDQVEWLDDNRILYGLARARSGTASSDVWVVPADGTGTPQVLIPDAWSPAVIRK
ncbi:TolB-like translocation protein; signal peptide [Rhizocola hellebori]|uniref:TolB-like translocation protein signal peptide n=1 Tax=Rhizocola hellebori TaxID=1392758 RepID=A0A8J3VMA2_9ACTN|nr:PD40 domain-containing protein [Rhizocola hellebori]GIH11008.1 TolB-like translocation protein; signal peptide [Rhizocola hellebori]